MVVLCVACLTSKLSLLFGWLQEGIEPYLLCGRQSTRPPTELASFALDMQWGLPSLPILARNMTLSESAFCPDSSVQSSRLWRGALKESIQTIWRRWECRVFSGAGKGVESLQAISRLLGPARMTAKWETFAGYLWSWFCLLGSSFPCLLHKSNFHMLAGQDSRILDPTVFRRFSIHETPVARLWRLLISLGGGQCNMLPALQGYL